MDNSFSFKKSFLKSLFYSIPMLLILFFLMTRGKPDFTNMTAGLSVVIVFAFFAFLYFMMHYTGKTDKFRAILFIVFAASLSYSVINHGLELRGSMSFSKGDVLECKIPFCHLAIPMMIIPAALTKSIIFSGSILSGFGNISTLVVLWIVSIIALGRGFCSWGCFYGGWDDAFSRIKKKPIITKIDSIWKWMPFAVLLLVVITSAISLIPTYCKWLCPYRVVTEYQEVASFVTGAKVVIFVSLFLALVIILPIVTKKRIQCGILCPLGALNSLFNKINPFKIKIDKVACVECMKCVKTCPLFALSKENIKKGEVSLLCAKCGKCVDTCSNKGIYFGIKGIPVGKRKNLSRNIFLFTSFFFMAMFSAGSIQRLLQTVLGLFM